MSITLTLKTRFTFIDASRRNRKRDVRIEPGTYRMLRVDNPLNRANLPWLVIEGTLTGLAESFIRQREEFAVVETADAAPGGRKKRGKRSDVGPAPVEARVIAAPVSTEESSSAKAAGDEPVAEELTSPAPAPEPVPEPIPDEPEPLTELEASIISRFLREMSDLEAEVAEVHPTVAAKPDIAANLTALLDLHEALKQASPAAYKRLREELKKTEARLVAQEGRIAAMRIEREKLEGEAREEAGRKIRKSLSVFKGMVTRTENLGRELRAFPAKRAEAVAAANGFITSRLIRKTARWLRNRQADFLRKHSPSPSAMGDEPEAAAPAIQAVEAPAEPTVAEVPETEDPTLDQALLEMMRSENLDPSNPEDVELARAIQAA